MSEYTQCKWCVGGLVPNPYCPSCNRNTRIGVLIQANCPYCSANLPANYMMDCGVCVGKGSHLAELSGDEQAQKMQAALQAKAAEGPKLNVETFTLPHRIFLLRPTNVVPGEAELGVDLNLSDGTYQGLLFTSEAMARRYIYIRGLKDQDIHEITFNGLVLLSRRLLEENVVKAFVIDYTSKRGRQVKSCFVRDIAAIPLASDKWESRGN